MSAVEVGRICVKLKGREAGRRCVIVDVIDRNYVLVTGPKDVTGVRRRRINMDHLMPLEEKIDVERGASDDEVRAALQAKQGP
ncbi:MAG: 50S ribosomal protein L14e [Candidatus Bathyarchaeia archaeon]